MGVSEIRNQAIHGIWRLISTRAISESGNELSPPYGIEPHGIAQFHSNSRMVCVLADGRSGLDPARAYLSYTGQYTIDDNELCTVVDGSSNTELLGKRQIRTIKLADGLLTLTTPPVAFDGDVVRREFVWDKLG